LFCALVKSSSRKIFLPSEMHAIRAGFKLSIYEPQPARCVCFIESLYSELGNLIPFCSLTDDKLRICTAFQLSVLSQFWRSQRVFKRKVCDLKGMKPQEDNRLKRSILSSSVLLFCHCIVSLHNLVTLDIFRHDTRSFTFVGVRGLCLLFLVLFRLSFLHCIIIMRFNVFSQVIAPHKSFTADGTSESLLARVRSKMPLQFVRPCKTLAAKQPVTHKWPLTSMPSQMSFQM